MIWNRQTRSFGGLTRTVLLSGTAIAALAALSGPALAQTVWQNPGTASWFTGANWSAGVPAPGVDATVDNGGTAAVDSGGVGAANNLLINASTVSVINGSTLSVSGATGSGQISLNLGTLRSAVAAGAPLAISTAIGIGASGGTIDSNGAEAVELSGAITGGGLLTLTNSVGDPPGSNRPTDFLLSGTNANTGGLSITGRTYVTANAADAAGPGSLNVGAGAVFGIGGSLSESVTALTGAGTISANGYLNSNGVGAGSLTAQSGDFSGVLKDGASNFGGNSYSGVLSLTKTSSGTLTLSGASTFSGGTALQGGTLAIADNSALGTAALTFASGTTLQSLKGLTVANDFSLNGIDTIDTIGPGSTVSPYSGGMDLTGILSDGASGSAGTLVKTGALGLRLTGANTYSGGTLLEAGHIGIDNDQSLGTGTLTFAGGFLAVHASGYTVSNAALLNQDGAIDTLDHTLTYAGQMSGTGQLTKLGSGTLTLSAANTFSGGMDIEAGIVQINNSDVSGTTINASSIGTGTLTLNGGTLQLAGSYIDIENAVHVGSAGGAFDENGGFLNIGGAISDAAPGAGPLTFLNTGAQGYTLQLSGTNTFTGGAIVTNKVTVDLNALNALGLGSLQIDAGGGVDLASFDQTVTALTGSGYVQNSGTHGAPNSTSTNTLTVSSGNFAGSLTDGSGTSSSNGVPITYTGILNLTKVSTGTLLLSGSNSYSGVTTVSAGTLQAGSTGAFSANSAFTVASNATLDLGGSSNSVASLAGAGTVTNSGATPAALTTGGSNASTAFSGNLTNGASNPLGLTKVGTGVFTLSGANSYSGETIVAGGTLRAGSGTAFSPNSVTSVNLGATLDLNQQSVTVGGLQNYLNGGGTVTNGASGTHATLTIAIDNASSGFGGTIQDGAGTTALVKTGTGTQYLTGISTYTGGTTVDGGLLLLGDQSQFGSITGPVAVGGGATLGFQEPAGSTPTAFAGTISGPGRVYQFGPGSIVLTGANSYTGPTNIENGTLIVGSPTALGTSSAVYVSSGGTLDLAGFSPTIGSLFDYTNGTGGGGQVLLNGGTLTVGSDNQNSAFSGAIEDGVSPGGGFVKVGTGRLALAGTSAYLGATLVSGGTLAAGATNALSASSAFTVLSGAALDVGGFNEAIGSLAGSGTVTNGGTQTAALTIGGTGASTTFAGLLTDGAKPLALTLVGTGKTAGATLTLAGTSTYTGATTVSGGTLKAGSTTGLSPNSATSVAAGATLDLGGFSSTLASLAGAGLVTNSGTATARLTTGGNNASTSVSGSLVDGASPLGLTKVGRGTLTLSGANSYSGGTSLDGGEIAVGNASAFGTGSVTAAAGTTISVLGSYDIANAFVFPEIGDPTIDTGPNSVVLSGPISGPGDLTKTGSGTLDLTGVNTYTGPTTVAQGTLLVDGSIANSAVTVENGASLGGRGVIGGLTVDSGATVAPGAVTPFSTLSVGGNVTFQSGSIFRVGVNAAGQTDAIAATGTATINGGTVDVVAGNGIYSVSTTYTILTAAGGRTGQFGNLTSTSNLAFLTPKLSYNADQVLVNFTQATVVSPGTPTTPPTVVPIAFASVAATPNQKAAAAAIQSLGAGNPLFNTVLSQTAAGAQQAFKATSGEAHANAPTQAIMGTRVTSGLIFDRLWNVSGSGGSDAVSVLDQFGSTTLPALVRCYTPVTEPGKETPAMYSVWAQGIGAFSRTIGDGNASSISSTMGGFAFGADTKIDAKGFDNWRVGVAGGYTNSAFTVKDGGGTGTFENIFGTLYGGARYGAVDVRLGASYGGTATNLRRTVAFPGFNEAERSSNDGNTVQGFGEVGYRLAFGETVVEPVLGGAITHVHQDSFREQGGAAALVGSAEDTDVGSTTVGVRGEAVPVAAWPLVARLFLGWQHAYGDVNPASTVAFASGSTQFETYGTPLDHNSVVAETGLDYRATAALSLGIAYTGQAGHHDRDNAVKGRMEYRF